MAQHQLQQQQQPNPQQRTPQNSPPSSLAPATSWPLQPAPPSPGTVSQSGSRTSSIGVGGVGAGSGSGSGGRPVSGTSITSSGIRGLFGRRSRSQQYQDLPHKPVDPQPPSLPKVYLSPPASPELLSQHTTPEKVRNGAMNGKSSSYSDIKSGNNPKMPPMPDSTNSSSQRNNRHSITSTAASLSPRMRRRRRDPTPFNILVIGFLGSGKTSFIRFLKDSLGDSKRIRNVSHMSNEEAAEQSVEEDLTQPPHKTNGFERHYLEKEVDGERVGLTIFDSEGFGPREQNIVDIQLSLLINFITGKFEETFAEETKVQRSQKHLDTHIHCALYMIDPTSPHYHYSLPYGLDALDTHILARLSRITTVIPIISKADTCTTARLNTLKSLIAQNIRQQNLRLTSFLSESESFSEDDEDMDEEEDPMDIADDLTLPLSILSPDYYAEASSQNKTDVQQVGRSYAWGFADALNPNHCDYVKLRELVFVDWRRELRDYSRQVLYEHWRSNLMRSLTH